MKTPSQAAFFDAFFTAFKKFLHFFHSLLAFLRQMVYNIGRLRRSIMKNTATKIAKRGGKLCYGLK